MFLILVESVPNFFKGKQIKKVLIIIYNFFFPGIHGNTLNWTKRGGTTGSKSLCSTLETVCKDVLPDKRVADLG